ncbi:MAG: hypothetical protein JSW68_04915 [Burkholderiales bacterium]|nr:MAG: hypothetical protein JSW68_04915 [Burkholderiales bacterium]
MTRIRAWWDALSLGRQFLVAGSAVLMVGMVTIGFWVTGQIEEQVVRNSASSTALYMDSIVQPRVQELVHADQLSPAARADMDAVLNDTALGRRVISFKIWKEGGLIAYSSRHELIGRRFEPTANLKQAWKGEVSAEFDALEDEEDALEREAGLALLEMYSPIRQSRTGRVIAVAEFYENAEHLEQTLLQARLFSWLVVGLVTLSMLGMLSGIVMRGSRTIRVQREALERRVTDLSRLLEQNEALRRRVEEASRRTTEINERYLRRISADLHDGPAQLLSLALLRLHAVDPIEPGRAGKASDARSGTQDRPQRDDLRVVQESVGAALAELRAICKGLVLPELDRLTPAQLLQSVVGAHERRTGSAVVLRIDGVPDAMERPLAICVYRFVQEALNNAFRHAGGSGQGVRAAFDGKRFEVTVTDEGTGFELADVANDDSRLGLRGLRERVESLGGCLSVASTEGAGTGVTMSIEL